MWGIDKWNWKCRGKSDTKDKVQGHKVCCTLKKYCKRSSTLRNVHKYVTKSHSLQKAKAVSITQPYSIDWTPQNMHIWYANCAFSNLWAEDTVISLPISHSLSKSYQIGTLTLNKGRHVERASNREIYRLKKERELRNLPWRAKKHMPRMKCAKKSMLALNAQHKCNIDTLGDHLRPKAYTYRGWWKTSKALRNFAYAISLQDSRQATTMHFKT